MSFKDFYFSQRLDEATIKQLRTGVNIARKKRSKPVKSELKSVGKDGSLRFDSTSITTENVNTWEQIIAPSKKIPKDISLADFREYYNGDVRVFCTCPDFKYRFAYRGTEEGYKLGNKELRPSNITNPEVMKFPEGTVCKHLENALTVVKPNLPSILKQFREKNQEVKK